MWGVPKEIQSDLGGEYNNNTLKILTENLLFKHRFILPHVHMGNGIAEAYCKLALNTTLKLCYQEMGNTSDWDLMMDQIQFALNTRVTANNIIPFTLMYGRNPFFQKETTSPISTGDQAKKPDGKETTSLISTGDFSKETYGKETTSPISTGDFSKETYDRDRETLLKNWEIIN